MNILKLIILPRVELQLKLNLLLGWVREGEKSPRVMTRTVMVRVNWHFSSGVSYSTSLSYSYLPLPSHLLLRLYFFRGVLAWAQNWGEGAGVSRSPSLSCAWPSRLWFPFLQKYSLCWSAAKRKSRGNLPGWDPLPLKGTYSQTQQMGFQSYLL